MPKAKAKRNWRHVHKIKVHDNRWLIWAISVSVLVLSVLIAYIQVSGINFDTQMGFDKEVPSVWSTFTHNAAGYNLKYPKSWGVESEGSSNMSFVDPKNPNEYYSVLMYPKAEERQVRTALTASGKAQAIIIGGLQGTVYLQNPDNTEKVAMVTEGDTVYVLRGKGTSFDVITETFRFRQEIE